MALALTLRSGFPQPRRLPRRLVQPSALLARPLSCLAVAAGTLTRSRSFITSVSAPSRRSAPAAVGRSRLVLLSYLATMSASDVGAAAASVPEKSEQPNTEALQELWASAYEGWIGPAGAPADEVVYLKPTGTEAEGSDSQCHTSWPAWVDETLKLADQHDGIFGITAFNPMGQDKPHNENVENNKLLEEDIKQLCAETGGTWWRSFGFASDWHEKGFSVAAPQDKMVALAKKYKQGAVYRFYRAPAQEACPAPFMRATVPASLPDTDADVPVVPCSRPPFDMADALWTPES